MMSRKKTQIELDRRRAIQKKRKHRKRIDTKLDLKRKQEKSIDRYRAIYKDKRMKEFYDIIRKKSTKPRILAVTDVEGWTGWRKMHETKKHLSNDFDIDITTINELQEIYNLLKTHDVAGHHDRVKMFEIHSYYDLLYFYVHTSLQYEFMQDLTKLMHQSGKKTAAIVTQKVILKKHWGKKKADRIDRFKQMSTFVDAYMINNLLVRPDLKKLWSGKIYYVPEGIDLDLFKPMKYDNTKEFTAAYAGKPAVEKGLETHIKPACKKAGVKLIYNTKNYITAIPYKDMPQFYNNAHVYVVASLVDGGPNPALEAAACGRPIISNVIGNMPQLIKNGVNGYIIKRQIDKYVEKLKELKANPEKARKMGMKAREAMEKSWSWEHVLNTYERPRIWEMLNGKD